MKPLRVLHVLPTMCLRYGSPARTAVRIARSCRGYGVESEFLTTDLLGRPVDGDDFPLHCFPARLHKLAYSRPLRQFLRTRLPQVEVCHIHWPWPYPVWAAGWEARRAGVPVLLSPHGGLSRLNYQGLVGLRNRALLRLTQSSILDHAAATHFHNQQETDAACGVLPPRVIMIGSSIESRASAPRVSPQFRLLSLSGLFPRKNIECLIQAMPLLPDPLRHHTVLRIAGYGRPARLAQLRALAADCDPGGKCIEFLGEVSEDVKAQSLQWASLLCLASHSEGQPASVIESLASALPVVINAHTNMPEVAQYGAGIIVAQNQPQDYAHAIAALLLDPERYRAASASALRLVDEHLLTSTVGQRWAEAYRSLAARPLSPAAAAAQP